MKRLVKPSTLQLTMPFGKTLTFTVVFLILFGSAAEGMARLDVFQARLTPPTLGSRHSQLGYKLTLLNADIRNKGPVDCIMVGSSTVDVGFDPEVFQHAYYAVTGHEIHCFNFGIDASSSISAAVLANILVEDYHPRLLIFGTDARDYAVKREDRDTAVVLDSPWIRYRDGHFSPEGWLLDHSYLYQYRQHLAVLLRFNSQGALWSTTNMSYKLRSNGLNPIETVGAYINDPPDPDDDSYEVVYYKRIYSSYQMLDENLAALEQIMDHKRSGTEVIVVEMPVSDGLYYFFGNGELDYDRFVAQVEKRASRHQVPFWRTEPLDSIPDDDWSDYSHLNLSGAEIFSSWLGEKVARLETQKDADSIQQ